MRCYSVVFILLERIAATAATRVGARIDSSLIGATRQVRGHGRFVDRRQQGVGLRQRAKLQLRRMKVIAQFLHGVRVDQCARGFALGMDRSLDVTAIMLSHRLFIRRFYWFPNSSDYIFIPFCGSRALVSSLSASVLTR